MKRLVLAIIVGATIGTIFISPNSHALGMKIAPLEYRTTLKKNEKQKAFIDISNPSGQAITVDTSVQAFRQVDNNGGLRFYDDKAITKGIKVDLTRFTLGPRQAIRMYFLVDGSLLPTGDVYGAIFFTTSPTKQKNGVGQLVRLGTLFSIVNQTPGDRKAEVTSVTLPFFQLTETVEGKYGIKNTSKGPSGFYPEVTISAWPAGEPLAKQSSLVFGGRERENTFRYRLGIGIHRVDVTYKGSTKSAWVIVMTPWILIGILLIIVIVSTELWLLRKRRRNIAAETTKNVAELSTKKPKKKSSPTSGK